MARQSRTPLQFNKTTRIDAGTLQTSGRAGVVVPLLQIPVLRGDSVAGRCSVMGYLNDMPKPIRNAVVMNLQAWFVADIAHPKFSGLDEFRASYNKHKLKVLGGADRDPPPFYQTIDGANLATVAGSDFFKTLGIHIPAGTVINERLIDAFNIIYNFRLRAHSSKLGLKKYCAEDVAAAVALPRAFWPASRYSRVVPDYDSSLIVGSLSLDVIQGRAPVSGMGYVGTTFNNINNGLTARGPTTAQDFVTSSSKDGGRESSGAGGLAIRTTPTEVTNQLRADVWAEMAGQEIAITTADLDKARVTQAFAKIAASYAGNDTTGFKNENTILAELLHGFTIEESRFSDPILLDSKLVPVNMVERFATDSGNLDKSNTRGTFNALLSLNVPVQEYGGYIIVTGELMPEKLYERQSDEALLLVDPESLPNALRDVQRTEPVDRVLNRRLDAKHSTPDVVYGYEPMNDVWNRDYTRLGGSYYQATPGNAWTEQRAAVWIAEVTDPAYSADHFLAPASFPHDVFADSTASAFEATVRHNVSLHGLTQIGDVLFEDNGELDLVEGERDSSL